MKAALRAINNCSIYVKYYMLHRSLKYIFLPTNLIFFLFNHELHRYILFIGNLYLYTLYIFAKPILCIDFKLIEDAFENTSNNVSY